MKNIFYKVIVFLLIAVSTQSCREEGVDVPEFNRTGYKSYSDIFESFWDVMNNNYLYFYEKGGDKWDDLYKTYKPKFAELKTFDDPSVDYFEAYREAHLAFKYFAEIIGPNVIDKHFSLQLQIPMPARGRLNTHIPSIETRIFEAGMTFEYDEENGFRETTQGHLEYSITPNFDAMNMFGQFVEGSQCQLRTDSLNLMPNFHTARLSADPSTLYIRSEVFMLSKFFPSLSPDRLPVLVDISDKPGLNQSHYDAAKRVAPAKAGALELVMKELITDLKTLVSSTKASSEYANYLRARNVFEETENPTSLLAIANSFVESRETEENAFVTKYNSFLTLYFDYRNELANDREKRQALSQLYSAFSSYISGLAVSSDYYDVVGELHTGKPMIKALRKRLIEKASDYKIYTKCFNLLSDGTIQKVILDLRGNGGGLILDSRCFIDRFITNKKVWGYQRIKEGNGRFNFSPWMPVSTVVHPHGIKQNIPICVLIDKSSASMSEVTCMQLKSQGDHVKLIGGNSMGATAGISRMDDFNGGYYGQNRVMFLITPNMAFKDANGNVIEGLGIIPDIKVPITLDQKRAYPFGGDPVLDAAKTHLGIQ